MDLVVGTIFEFFQYISFMFAILTLYFIVKRGIANKQLWFDVPLILLLAHGIIYYIALFGMRLYIIPRADSPVFFTSWSTALRLHTYATLLIMSVTNYIREKNKIWKF